jgi:hypothetical protein
MWVSRTREAGVIGVPTARGGLIPTARQGASQASLAT